MVHIFFRDMRHVPGGQIEQLASLIVAIVFLPLSWYVCGTLVAGKSIVLSTPGSNWHRPEGCQYLMVHCNCCASQDFYPEIQLLFMYRIYVFVHQWHCWPGTFCFDKVNGDPQGLWQGHSDICFTVNCFSDHLLHGSLYQYRSYTIHGSFITEKNGAHVIVLAFVMVLCLPWDTWSTFIQSCRTNIYQPLCPQISHQNPQSNKHCLYHDILICCAQVI